MRGEKRLGALGLVLFFLFPLVGLFQLGDADGAWRQVAERARPSVLTVHETRTAEDEASTASACAVVLSDSPCRAVIVGPAPAVGLRSPTRDGWCAWKPIYSDPEGSFTILEAVSPAPDALSEPADRLSSRTTRQAGSQFAAAGLAVLHSEVEEDSQPVPAVLVSPAALAELRLWVGVLEAERDPAGSSVYRGSRFRELAAPDVQAGAARASAAGIHPALSGAPFVTREGVAVALYAGSEAGAVRAVPIGRVRAALARLDRERAAGDGR